MRVCILFFHEKARVLEEEVLEKVVGFIQIFDTSIRVLGQARSGFCVTAMAKF